MSCKGSQLHGNEFDLSYMNICFQALVKYVFWENIGTAFLNALCNTSKDILKASWDVFERVLRDKWKQNDLMKMLDLKLFVT